MAAKKKPLEQAPADVSAPALETVALTPPPERPAPTVVGEGAAAVTALIDKLQNEAKAL